VPQQDGTRALAREEEMAPLVLRLCPRSPATTGRMHMLPRPALLLILLGFPSALGCASSQVESGICIGDETLKQFEPGETRETWLRAVLGEPSSVSTVADEPAVRVLRYSTQQPSDDGLLDSLLGPSGEITVATIYFIVRDGVVEHFWADRMTAAGLFGRAQESGEKRDG
jgi:hypothetical protein